MTTQKKDSTTQRSTNDSATQKGKGQTGSSRSTGSDRNSSNDRDNDSKHSTTNNTKK